MIGPLAAELGIGRTIVVDADSRLIRWASQRLALPAFPEPDALAILQYTGGTTGRSKGVNLTHRAVSTNVAQREALLPSGDDENILIVTPTYHSYAIAMGLLLAPYCHGTLSILPRYRPDDTLRTIEAHGITLFAGSPTLFVGLMAHEAFATTNFASLRLCFSGSSALPMETMRRWEAATGCTICEGYGQSEAGPVLTFNPRDGIRKQGSVGVPVPQTEVQIVDTETGTRLLAPNEPGEIRARGPQIMSGYRNRPEETAAALRDGWLYTGDIGAIDEDGYLFILDRKKDMAIVGGFNVYPREIEEALCAHPAVEEAAVIGVPDSYRGEALIGYVVLRQPDAGEPGALTNYLAERLTRYKIPRDIRSLRGAAEDDRRQDRQGCAEGGTPGLKWRILSTRSRAAANAACRTRCRPGPMPSPSRPGPRCQGYPPSMPMSWRRAARTIHSSMTAPVRCCSRCCISTPPSRCRMPSPRWRGAWKACRKASPSPARRSSGGFIRLAARRCPDR